MKGAADATTALAAIITQVGFYVVRIKLVNGNHSPSVLAMCDTGSSFSLLGK